MNRFLLFLPGTYPKKERNEYRDLLKGRTTIAVDGGLRFFQQEKIEPNLLIGDFDSLPERPELSDACQVFSYSSRKNKTDLELAIEYCLDKKAETIEIVMPDVGECDHFFGNLLLLSSMPVIKWVKKGGRIAFLQPGYEYHLLVDCSVIFNKKKAAIVSVFPLSSSIRLTCQGTSYDTSNTLIKRGTSRGMRNKIVRQKASFLVAGSAWLIIHN